MSQAVLQVVNVTKSFGATQALVDVNVEVRKGTVHALVGRNGAGKSTLVNIIAGIYPQNSGSVLFEGTDISKLNVFERQKLGIRLVTQHASIIPHLSVSENIFMGLWPKKNRFIDWNKMYEEAGAELRQYGLDVDLKKEIRHLSAIDQRKVNIVRSLFGGAKLVILDEPTTSLSSEDRDNLFSFVDELSKQGTTFMLISHYLEEVIRMSDEITVLRDGNSFTGYTRGSLNEETLANLIAGENVKLYKREKKPESSDYVLECKNVSGKNIQNISFNVAKGEIAGLVGFPGSGARELCRGLYGLNPFSHGELVVNGSPCKTNTPTCALKQGIVYVPNDRHNEGVVELLSIRENISLPILQKLKNKYGLIKASAEKDIAEGCLNRLSIKARTIEDLVEGLSGGNQQKVVIGKVISCEPSVLILDEPTVGIDIKSREEILQIVDEMTKAGVAILYLTNDYDEMVRVADRLLFFSDGKIIADEKNENLTVEKIIEIRDMKRGGAA